jgi:sterol desaturase/sphingolipid hydroxylase (fatty acid hydroxylase superfamily)
MTGLRASTWHVKAADRRNSLPEASIRFAFFLAVFAAIAVWEWRLPRRAPQLRGARWAAHIILAALNTVVVRIIAPASEVTFALWAERNGWGLLRAANAPGWLEALCAVVALDLVVYVQHRLLHAVPWLWRMHRIHHADLHVDVTTGVRFHPFEIALSTLLKGAAIVALGASPVVVLVFEILLNAGSLFSHANGSLPSAVERRLRRVLVTPDMHRVHHSIAVDEQNTNFGFNLAWWDRVFGTYRPAPAAAHESMAIGLAEWRGPATHGIVVMLTDPVAPHHS